MYLLEEMEAETLVIRSNTANVLIVVCLQTEPCPEKVSHPDCGFVKGCGLKWGTLDLAWHPHLCIAQRNISACLKSLPLK